MPLITTLAGASTIGYGGLGASVGGGGVAGAYESIASFTAGSSGLQTISFTSIPATFKHLQIRYVSRNQAASDATLLRFNNESAGQYSAHRLSNQGSFAVDGYANTNHGELPTVGYSGIGAGVYGFGVIDILEYANTNIYKTVKMRGGMRDVSSSTGSTAFNSMNWRSLSAITSIQIIPSPNWVEQYSVFSLYGIKG